MPGNVSSSSPTTVLPASLYTALVEVATYAAIANDYRQGENQRDVRVSADRRAWRFSKRLTYAQWNTLRTFYLARKGNTEAFYFYNPHETSPRFTPDPTGVATTGRYTVRFDGALSISFTNNARGDLSLAII